MVELNGKSGSGRVAILLAVFNGEKFLQEQLDSLAGQTVETIDVWASDDGSTDGSRDILRSAARNWQKGYFHILDGPGAGFAENFRSLMANPEIEADFFAFCDQDDLWDPDKLAEAISWLNEQEAARPALYCSRTRIISATGETIGLSPLFPKRPGFRNAIVQSIAGSNTMVMNRKAWTLVSDSARRTTFVAHDWWCYLVVSGAGGVVHYSPIPRVGYRQHQSNQIGENNSWRARMSRLRHLIAGRFIAWNDKNLVALANCEDLLRLDTLTTVKLFATARRANMPTRVLALLRSGVYRQTLLGQLGLYAACLLKRL